MTKKRTIFYVGVAALLLSSCLNGPETLKTDITVENIPVELYNEIQQVPITRVNDSGFCDGDGVGVYVVNYENSQPGTLRLDGNQADNVKYVFNETDYRWIPEKDVNFRDRYTHVDIIGYYPYSNPTSISAYPFEISKDQSKIAAHGLIGGYEESDFLYAKASDVAPTASRIPLNFQHKMAGVLVTIAEGSGFESGEFAALEKAVIVSSTVRKTEIDLATGAITPIGEAPVAGIIPYKYGNDFRAVVVPQTVAANAPLFNITVDNSNYIYRKKVSGNPSDFTYIGGKLHKFTISVSKKEGGGIDFELISEGITAWDTDNATHSATVREYIVIHSETPGGLKDAIIAAGKNPAKVRNLKVTGKVDARDFSMMREEMSVLQSVNMKDVIIESFAGNDANCIPDYAFSGKSSLVRFVFPDRTIRIEESAFTGTSLSGSLILPESIEIIGARAFAGCSTLTGTLSLPKSLRIIGNAAFSQCSGIVGSLDLPESVESIQGGAFQACGGLTGTLYLPANP